MENEMQVALVSAAIGAVAAITSIWLKDYLLPIWQERRGDKKADLKTFKKYADPILIAADALFWRLNEVFGGRSIFLLKSAPDDKYYQYKLISTLYRLCSMIGWLRAAKRELSFFEIEAQEENNDINDALSSFEKALADGFHVEVSRVEFLAKHWQIDISKLSLEEKKILGLKVEREIKRKISEKRVNRPIELDDNTQLELLRIISNNITALANTSPVSDESLQEWKQIGITEISTTEAWIYRDWQSAIGDIMIKSIENFPRRYDVIGFLEFEHMYEKEDKDEFDKWINDRAFSVINDLNTESQERFDVRVEQLKNVFSALVEIISAFSKIETGQVRLNENEIRSRRTISQRVNPKWYFQDSQNESE